MLYTDVTVYEFEGWQLWTSSWPLFDVEKNYMDLCTIDVSIDVMKLDRSVESTNHFFERGNALIKTMTNRGWLLGQLLGRMGSNPNVIVQSSFFAPVDLKRYDLSE